MTPTSPSTTTPPSGSSRLPSSASTSSSPRKRNRPISYFNYSALRVSVVAVGFSVLLFPFLLYSSLNLSSLDDSCGDALSHEYYRWVSPSTTTTGGTGGGGNTIQRRQRIGRSILVTNDTYVAEFTLDRPPPASPYPILHTVTTRFMVGQPERLILARARYLLFETFCWPTMRFQTSQNFFWLILVDPRLDVTILRHMEGLLAEMPTQNAYMVLTTNTKWVQDGIGVQNATSYGVGLQTVASAYRDGQVDIVTGNVTYLYQALELMGDTTTRRRRDPPNDNDDDEKKPILVIETLLDADDGLNNHAVDWIQQLAMTKSLEQQLYLTHLPSPQLSLNSTWWFLCGTNHIEWHNRDIFKITSKWYDEFGITSGLTGLRKNPYFCTSAGFTRIGLTNTSLPDPMQFPRDALSNHAMAFYFPTCTNDVAAASERRRSFWSSVPAKNISLAVCYRRAFPDQPFVLKSRSITSDSMENMNPSRPDDYRDVAWLNKTVNPLWVNETELTWDVLRTDFAIDRRRVWEISVFLYENRREILRENAASRCAPGFPCNEGAKKNLKGLERFWARQEEALYPSSARTFVQEGIRLQAERARQRVKGRVGGPNIKDAIKKTTTKTTNKQTTIQKQKQPTLAKQQTKAPQMKLMESIRKTPPKKNTAKIGKTLDP